MMASKILRRSLVVLIVATLYYVMMLWIAFDKSGGWHFGEAALATVTSAAILVALAGIAMFLDRLWR